MLHAMLVGLAILGAPVPGSPEPDEAVKDRKAFIPFRKHEPLKGKTVAVLITDVKGYMGFDGRSGPPDAMGLSLGNNSYRWIYIPTPEAANPLIRGLNVPVGEKGIKKKVYAKLGMANPALVKRWGITAPYSLVEVEVNDGEGAPPDESFVATKMSRLDGTKAYPLDVTRVIEAIKKRHQADVKAITRRIETLMDAEGKKALKGRKATGPRETKELMYVTWLPKPERLRVAFRTRLSDGAYTSVGGGARPGPFPLPPPGAKPAARRFPPPPPPGGFGVRVGTTFGVEYGFAYEVDRAGKMARRQLLKPEGFSRELPVPPAIGRPRPGG